jgi:hypothetical protein
VVKEGGMAWRREQGGVDGSGAKRSGWRMMTSWKWNSIGRRFCGPSSRGLRGRRPRWNSKRLRIVIKETSKVTDSLKGVVSREAAGVS